MTSGAVALLATALLGFASGYLVGRQLGPRYRLPNDDTFRVDVQRVLGPAIISLKAENKLIVYRFSGDARVRTTISYGPIRGDQQLIVPGTVVYFVDMAEFGPKDVRYDKASETVEIKLPPLRLGDIAFQPEQATEINGGLITMNNSIVAELVRDNYAGARHQFLEIANSQQNIDAAKAQAIKDVTAQFEVPLRTVGHKDTKVSVHF